MNINQFRELPILGIVRGIDDQVIEPLVETVVSAGLRTIEIALNTPHATKLIRHMADAAGDNLYVGAGTVLSTDDLHRALDAGATFIVSPTLVPEIVGYCAEQGIPVFPGALTPQEIYNAWQAGATMVKVFPAKFYGPSYIKEVKGPFQDIELLACGGITPESIGDFLTAGASAVAFGGSVFNKRWIADGEYYRIGDSIKSLITAFQSSRADMA